MRIARRMVGPVLAAGLGLAGSVAVAPAAPASPLPSRPLPIPAVQYCAAVLGHVPGADGRSPALGQACSPDSREDALAAADGANRSAEGPAGANLNDAVRGLPVFHG